MTLPTNDRPDWDKYFQGIAFAVAARADCTRRLVGAVIVNPFTHYIISTGYNGSAPGEPGCLSDGACPRGRHYQITTKPKPFCACGEYWPCKDAIPPNSSYDTGPGTCIAIHAEANALLRAGRDSRNAFMYITGVPCDGCVKLMKGAGMAGAIWPSGKLLFDL